jgi:hypothetical protein
MRFAYLELNRFCHKFLTNQIETLFPKLTRLGMVNNSFSEVRRATLRAASQPL